MIARLLTMVMVLGATAFAQPGKTVARVVSVEGLTFTIEVLEGDVSDTEKLELWTSAGKKSVTMAVPGSGYVERGRSATGVSCTGGSAVARAVITKPGQVASWAAAQAAVSAFPPKVLARVVSIEGATVTVEVLVGSLTNGTSIDVLTPDGSVAATVKFPSGVDLMMKGDKLKGVTLDGARVSAGAMVADRARFGSLAEATALAGSTPAPAAAAPAIKPNPAACVFTIAELKAALGFEVDSGSGTETPFTGGASLSCRYLEPKGSRSVTVNRTVMTTGSSADNANNQRSILAGRLEPIAGDPDGGGWQVGQGDLTDVTLHYWRNNVGTEIRVGGVVSKGAAAVTAMRRNVLKLRRP